MDNWLSIVAECVRQIEADGADSDTWLSQGCRQDRDTEERWSRSGPRLALVSTFNGPMCHPLALNVVLLRYATLNTLLQIHPGPHGADTPTLHLPRTGLGLVLVEPPGAVLNGHD